MSSDQNQRETGRGRPDDVIRSEELRDAGRDVRGSVTERYAVSQPADTVALGGLLGARRELAVDRRTAHISD